MPVSVPYANLTDPQTLNLYAMVSDDPESFADLDGHYRFAPGTSLGDKQAFRNALDDIEGVVGWTLMGATGSSLGQAEAMYDAQVMQDSVDAYGREGDNNGVTVAFAPDNSAIFKGNKQGTTLAEHLGDPNTRETVTFQESSKSVPPSFASLVVHEGTHVSDFKNPAARHWNFESRAYHSQAIFMRRYLEREGDDRGTAQISGVTVWAPWFTSRDVQFWSWFASEKNDSSRQMLWPPLPGGQQ